MQSNHAVEFGLLGPIVVSLRGQSRQLGGPRQRAVLVALLLHANEEVRTNHLLELVWSDVPSSAESNLRTYLARLRRILRVPGEPESRLQTRRGGHLVTVRPGELDVTTFTSLADKGEQTGDRSAACRYFERALSTWRGRALENASLGPLLEAEATQLEARRERVREQYLHSRLALGQHAELLPELRALLLRNPLWERLAGMVMVALYRSGQRTEALTVFRQTRDRLVEELGVEPGPELRDLHQRMLAGEDPGATMALPPPDEPQSRESRALLIERSPEALARITGTAGVPGGRLRSRPARPEFEHPVDRPAQLPVDVPAFSGRAIELLELLNEGTSPPTTPEPDRRSIIAIDGMPGVGKTTLAVHAAHRLAPHYPDGQLFLDLQGYARGADPLHPEEALHRMLSALGVPSGQMPPCTDSRASLYRSLLAHRKVLVVLDNAHDEAQVRLLLPGSVHSQTLITSRRRLTGLHQAHPMSIDVMPRTDAVAMFARISNSWRPATETPESIQAIVEMCGRLPLAIRIAADRLRDRPFWTLNHLHQRLVDEEELLAELSAGEKGVIAAFEPSIAALAPDRRRALTMLGLHPCATFDIEDAAALLGSSVAATDRLLEELVDAHLLRQTAPGCYELHRLIRAFMQERARAANPAETNEAMHRLLDRWKPGRR